ncbi:hypothetical protein AAFF_G00361830 [Aldrovandia affinis]|uniref:Reverse transcriptase/retrotransposon-derived protein RNase H-like domain-containing protein n=1 Tax=Aldrovandia affinis TaxID=143900 RepID=A0AAD7WNU2_9TELE|nr:hypothetical protein AAFF_G00361830 [Aldrovandia affinis]
MERVLSAVPRSCCVVYLDCLLVHASSFEPALANLHNVLAVIRQTGLWLNPRKCQLLRRQTAFLGHVVSERGVATDPAKVTAVQDWPTLANVGELRSLLGLVVYRRFVRSFASIASPLHHLTDKYQPFVWTEECAKAFAQLRTALTEAPVLAYPDVHRPFIVDTDASNMGVGAVLSQEDSDEERAVAYYSGTLSRAERNYCVTCRELLAVLKALRHFRPYLQASHFCLRTDHASLTWLLNFKHPEDQVARWLEELQECNFQIEHRAGRHHTNADALSRHSCAELGCRHCHRQEEKSQVEPEVAAEQLREGQEADGTLRKVRGWLEVGRPPQWAEVLAEGPELKAYYGQWRSLELRDGLAYRRWQAPGLGSDLLQLLVPRALGNSSGQHCKGQAFKPGDRVWIHCPVCKKGLSPKLQSHWRGPGEVVGRLSEVTYRVRMPNRGCLVVLYQDRLAPYHPLAEEDAAGGQEGSSPVPSTPPAAEETTVRPTRQRRLPSYLNSYGDCGVIRD